VHLLLSKLTVLVQKPDLLQITLSVLLKLILMFYDIETCLENTFVLFRVPNFDLSLLGP
jgi:hypothetical protein